MAKTNTPPIPEDNDGRKTVNDLTAAAFIMEERGPGSLLYNSQTIDYLTNSIEAGDTQAAWFYWSRLPELRYVTRYIANALSVATLYVGIANKGDNRSAAPSYLPEGHPATELMSEFAGGYGGQSEILDRLGLHLTVAGDSILIGPRAGIGTLEPPFDQWRVYSNQEVYSRNGKVFMKVPGNAKEIPVPASAFAVRVWRPHPKLWWDADSPVKGSFQVLKELDMLNQHIISSASSRLVGAGLLGLPEELDLPVPETEIDGTEVDNFVAMLIEIMGLAKKNPESAAAQIPVILRGPAEYIDKIKHFDFSTKFDSMVPQLREGAIRRLALGMDVPPEILLGSGQSNSWSAWQTDESTLRVHLIPLLQLICSSLTVGWLRPMLETLPLSEAQKAQIPDIVIHFDVSNLKIHQNVSGDAEALYDRLAIDDDALRLAMGYSPGDAPDNKELAKRILFDILKGNNPQMVPYAIMSLRDKFGVTDLPDPKDYADELFPRATAAVVPTGEGDVAAPPKGGAPGAPIPGAGAPVGAPTQAPPPATTQGGKGAVPGARSQAKQVSSPPTPKIGDQSNNGPTVK